MDTDNPPEAYFEAMRRLRPEPPDEETVDRIVEIYRSWWWKKERENLEREGPGVVPPPGVPRGRAMRFRTYLVRGRSCRPCSKGIRYSQ